MTRTTVLIDTGPLVALTHQRDQYHQWARQEAANLKAPFLTCEAVWSEAWFLLQKLPLAQAKLLHLLENGLIQIRFNASGETASLLSLLRRYANVPMSVADACLVRMSELQSDCVVFTTDSDFNIYRRNGNQLIPVLLRPSP
jgi:predicted nucleic acid-binding protein